MNKEDRKNKGVMMSQHVKEKERKFPAGIRVLVVDDDETCLLWVENLLLTCNFKATTTLYAREAIEMLRRNKSEYDLVITDVQMPEMDGFELLELIGLEMDLPVIMMSIYSHQNFVEKGVKHGAVDYLVKPVRLEEIQNIWQHVLRKRKTLIKEKRLAYRAKSIQGGANCAAADTEVGAGDTSSKRGRDQPDDDDDDFEENDDSDRENEEPTTHKRPRVVWKPSLHQKFVAAVNHLGIDKAVPKKILDIMDVDTLTRENIASHLQKYRMYLKKLSNRNAPQETSEGLGGINSFTAMKYVGGRYSNSPFPDYSPNLSGFLGGRSNISGISSSDLIQSGQNLRNAISPHAKLQPNRGMPSFPNGNLLQGMAGGFEQDPTQAGKTMAHLGGYNAGHGATGFGVSDNIVDPKMVMNGSNGNSSLMVSGPSQFSLTTHSPVSGAFNIGGMPGSSNAGFVDRIGNSDSWKSVAHNPQSSYQMDGAGAGAGAFTQNQLPMYGGIASSGNQQQLLGFPKISAVPGDASSFMHNVSFPSTQGWDNNKTTDYSQDMNNIFDSLNPITTTNGGGLVANGDNFIGHIHGTAPQTMGEQIGVLEQVNFPQDVFTPHNIESMDDIMNTMTTRDNNNGPASMFMDDEFNFDAYNPGPGL